MKRKQNDKVRASALQISLALALTSISAVLFAASFGSPGGGARGPGAEEPNVPISAMAIEKVTPSVFNGDVRDLPQVPQTELARPELQPPFNAKQLLAEAHVPQPETPNIPLAPMPAPIQNFPGITRTDTCTGGQCGAGTPPDTNGAVGRNHYIQAVNSAYGIYNKTGTLLASFTENALWAGSGTFCEGNGGGDPVVIYDALADRWILTHLAYTGGASTGPFYQCIAASKTSDPVSGGWYLYAVRTDTGVAGQPPVNTINDYPKFGIWTDCLYYAANGFQEPAGSYNGGEFASFSRSDMYAGLPLTGALGFAASTNDFFTMIPSNLEAPVVGGYNGVPPAGTPNYYVQESLTAFNYRVRKFTPGTNCGGGGTLSAATTVGQTSYTGSGTGVPQPNTTNTLDTLFDRMMQKVQYRKVGSAESLWVVHSVQNSGATNRPQWAQINITGGTITTTPVQEQIYGPDSTLHRWMGSIAADIQGNAALGYSTSNATSPNFPSIAYSGRLAGDPLNTLPQTETQLIAGAGSQTGTCGGSPCHRWGDYASMSVDPSDGCTFWYTTEYYTSQANGSNSPPIWSTRIGSFKFPSCAAPTPAPSATPTATPTSTPAATATATATFTPTATATATATPTATAAATATATATFTPTPAATATFTPTPTPEASPTPTTTATFTPTPTPTPEQSPTPTPTATANPTPTPTAAPTPAAPTALTATNVTANSFTANWKSVSGATGYRLDVATSSSFINYVPGYQDLDVGNTTSRNVTGLTKGTNYYYRLRAYNGDGTSPNSNVIKVKTRSH